MSEQTYDVNAGDPVLGTRHKLRVAIGSGVGTTVENFDFIGYGTAAALYFGHAFFPNSDPVAGTLLAFATLGIGFAARPLGGIIGGYLGDKIGRRPVLITSLLVMGIATVMIGLLPTYQQVGILAPILLVTVRVIQGLAFGAEWGGAILMTFEHAPWKKKGQYTAIPQAGFPLGLLLANLAFLAASGLPGDWAWRLPFLLSAFLIGAGLYIRLKVEESPEFELAKEEGDAGQEPAAHRAPQRLAQPAPRVRPAGRRDRRLRGRHHVRDLLPALPPAGDQAADHPGHRDRRPVRLPGHAALGPADRPDRPQARLSLRHHRDRAVRHPDVPAAQHRPAGRDHRGLRRRLRDLPELPRRHPGRLVLRAVRDQHPLLRRLPRLPAVRGRLRLHGLLGGLALPELRLGRPGRAVLLVRPDRPDRGPRNAGDQRCGPPRAGRGAHPPGRAKLDLAAR